MKKTGGKRKKKGIGIIVAGIAILSVLTLSLMIMMSGKRTKTGTALKEIDLSAHPEHLETENESETESTATASSETEVENSVKNPNEIPMPSGVEARNIFWEDAQKVFEQYGVQGAVVTAGGQNPWRAKDGGFCQFLYNAFGTTVLYAQYHPDGTKECGIWGSQYNKGFIGVNFSRTDGTYTLDPKNMDLLEAGLIAQGVNEITTIVANDGEYVTCRTVSGTDYKVKVQ